MRTLAWTLMRLRDGWWVYLTTWIVHLRLYIDFIHYSIPNGLAVAIAAESPSTSLRSATSITRLSPLTTLP
jgi:hypothetical protein